MHAAKGFEKYVVLVTKRQAWFGFRAPSNIVEGLVTSEDVCGRGSQSRFKSGYHFFKERCFCYLLYVEIIHYSQKN